MPPALPFSTASRARWLLVSIGLLFGLMTSSWLARPPRVHHRPAVRGPAAQSMGACHALLLVTVAMVASVSVAGQVRRSRPVPVPSTLSSEPAFVGAGALVSTSPGELR